MRLGYLRVFLFTDPMIVLATIVMGSISLLTSLFYSTGRAQHSVARLWSHILLLVCGVRVRVEGIEKIPPGASCVFVCNHLSYIDTPVVLSRIPAQFRFLAKESLFRIPFLGYHLDRAGHIRVPREDPRASVRAMTEAARVIREQGISVLVFPEGGRSHNGQLQEFKEGAAYIAIKAGVPIVPMAVSGTREIMAMHSSYIQGGTVRLRVGDPVATSGLTLRDRAGMMACIRERVAALL